jgi:hypothetical protein
MLGTPAIGVLVAGLLATGCTSSDVAQQPERTETGSATLGFTQLIPREGTRDALLRVTNTGDAALEVESVAIEWAGYPAGEPSPADPTIPAGRTLDVQLELPDPDCGARGGGPVVGVVETSRGSLRRELEPSGTTYVRRLWRTQCDIALVRNTVDIAYSSRWRVVGEGTDAVALGDLELTRREGDEPVEVEDADGSVLHGLRFPGPTVLEEDQTEARLPLAITPGNRCDEHARGQATAPFDFLVHLRIGDREAIAYRLEVPLPAMNAATDALDVACAARARRLD